VKIKIYCEDQLWTSTESIHHGENKRIQQDLKGNGYPPALTTRSPSLITTIRNW